MDMCQLMGFNCDPFQCVGGSGREQWVSIPLGAAGVSLPVFPFSIDNMMCYWGAQRCPRHRPHPFQFLCSSLRKQSKRGRWERRAGCEPLLDDVLSRWMTPLMHRGLVTGSVAGVSHELAIERHCAQAQHPKRQRRMQNENWAGKNPHGGWKQERASTSADGF